MDKNEKLIIPSNYEDCPYLIHLLLCLSLLLPVSLLSQGDVGFAGAQGEKGFQGDKVCILFTSAEFGAQWLLIERPEITLMVVHLEELTHTKSY